MKNKEEELLSVQYRIEKSGVKQQKLENQLVSISKELKKSKRNSLIFMIFFLAVIAGMAGAMYYLRQNDSTTAADQDVENNQLKIGEVQKINDSLRRELTKLKADISKYKNEWTVAEDTTNHQVVNIIEDTTQVEVDTTQNKLKFEKKHGYVKKVFRNNGVIFIEVDFIEYFQGKKAVKKAKENNEAEYDIDKNGDTLYFLYNNYYVTNTNERVRRLELNDRAHIQDLNQISRGFPLKAFQKIIADNPIMVLEIRDGIVYKIRKQKFP